MAELRRAGFGDRRRAPYPTGAREPSERRGAAAAEKLGLTPRQTQIMELIAIGLVDKQIAARLGLSHSTVRTHIQRIYTTHGLSNRAEAAATWIAASTPRAPERRRLSSPLVWVRANPVRTIAAGAIAVAGVLTTAGVLIMVVPHRGTPEQVVATINADRPGLPPLTWSQCLASTAESTARDIADIGYVGEPVQGSPAGLCGSGGRGVRVAVYWSEPDLAAAERLLAADPRARAAIRGPYRRAGAAWATGKSGTAFFVLLLN